MGKRTGIIAAIAVACLACAVGMVFAIKKIREREGGGVTERRLPRDTFAVLTVDMHQARAWPTARSIHASALDASSSADLARRYRETIQGCGFDPWEKLDQVTIGADRSSLQGSAQSAGGVTYLDGTFTQAQATRCLQYVFSRDERFRLEPSRAGSHQVFTELRAGSAARPDSTQFVMLGSSVLMTQRGYAERALAVVDGSAPGLPSDSPLRAMLGRLGRGNLVNGVVDLAAVRTQNSADYNAGVDALVRSSPGVPNLDLARQATTGGLAVSVVNSTVTATLRVAFPSGEVAGRFRTAMEALVRARRGDLQRAVDEMRVGVVGMRAALAMTNSDLRPHFDRIEAAFPVLRALPDQVRVTADGAHVVLTLPIQPAQVATLEGAVRAVPPILQAMQSLRGIPGLGGRRPAPSEPQGVPSPESPPAGNTAPPIPL